MTNEERLLEGFKKETLPMVDKNHEDCITLGHGGFDIIETVRGFAAQVTEHLKSCDGEIYAIRRLPSMEFDEGTGGYVMTARFYIRKKS